jgi:protein-S-isoprenylcysteine O-methyltransferase Ste14
MFITGFEEFLNVWANDGAKISIFIFVLSLPFIARVIISFKNNFFFDKTGNKIFNRDIPNIIFCIIAFFNMLSVLSFGQLILPPLFDAILRSFGIFIYLNGIFFYLIYIRQLSLVKKETDIFEVIFFRYSRNPDVAILIIMLLGSSLLSLSFLGIIITCFAYIPLMITRALDEEKMLLKLYKKYSDYKDETPIIIPELFKIFKKMIYKKIS